MKKIVPNTFFRKIIVSPLFFLLLLFCYVNANAQVSITNTSPVIESFTGFSGATTPANWNIQGTGIESLLWNGTAQTTGTTGGWYGNENMSFLGTTNATKGNATWTLQNNSGYTITGFSLAFTAMLWKADISSPNVKVYYQISSSSVPPPQGTAGFTQLSSLTFNDATANISTGAFLSQTISSLNIPNNYYIFIRFIHDGGVTSDNLGWDDVSFTAVIPQVNINSISPAAGNIYQGVSNNILQTFTLQPLYSSLTLSSLSVNTGGGYVIGDLATNPFKLYYNTSNTLTGATQIGTSQAAVASGVAVNFTGLSQSISAAATGYFIVTVDLANTATINNKINIAATSLGNISFSVVPAKNGANPLPASSLQTIISYTSVSTDYFRSVATGNWSSTSTWQSSPDGSIWHPSTLVPTSSSTNGITIKSGTNVTIDAAVTAKTLTIESGGTLTHTNGKTLTLSGASSLFTINGTYVINGTMPTVGGAAVINNGGIVRADDNTGGGSDDFARQTNVEFKSGAVFQWNIAAQAFQTDNVTYFQGPNYATNKPIFRITAAVSVGASNNTTFNGKLESTVSNPQFKGSGIKIFRDGFGGTGKLTHATNSGPFEITASDAVIDGSLILNIDDNASLGNDLWIASGATVTISGSPTINIGKGAAGADMVIDGTLIHNGTTAVQIASGNLYINGYLDPSSTGTFTFSASTPTTNSNVSVGGTSNTYAGALKLTTGADYINTFTMNRGTSGTGGYLLMNSNVNAKNIVLTRGVLATGNNLTTWLNAGGTLTLPASYSNSYICTCNSSGVAITPNGSNGFRINNVSGASDQMFPVGTDFNSANRMAINMNSSIADNFTVVVGKGDIGNTPLPKVNRIWYVSEGTAGGSTATMKLYFTKRDWTSNAFGSANNDEIEDGFLWTDPHLVQENYSNLFTNVAATGTSDVPDFSDNISYPYSSEVYGLYTKGISKDYLNALNGITGFTRFAVVNAEGIILSSAVTNIRAYQKGSAVQIDWTALNESNVKQYEVQRSSDGILFNSIATVVAANNGASQNNYNSTDAQPLHGNNFYRIKITDNNGATKYTAIVKVALNNSIPSITIQPNPVVNKTINLALGDINAGKYNLVVYNLAGQKMLAQTISHAGGSASQLITLPASVKAGIYLVKFFNETTDFSVRIVVQ